MRPHFELSVTSLHGILQGHTFGIRLDVPVRACTAITRPVLVSGFNRKRQNFLCDGQGLVPVDAWAQALCIKSSLRRQCSNPLSSLAHKLDW